MDPIIISEMQDDLWIPAHKFDLGDINGNEFAAIVMDYVNTGVTSSGATIDQDTKEHFLKYLGI